MSKTNAFLPYSFLSTASSQMAKVELRVVALSCLDPARPTSMPVAYFPVLDTRIIAAWKAKEGTQRPLAERFKVSLSFVQWVLQHYRQTGETTAKPRGATLAPTLSGTHLNVVKNLMAEQPTSETAA